jgi:Rhodopirellula transposase DDE domain
VIEPETAGDPMSERKWVRHSLRQISGRLAELGHAVSPPTVGRLLKGMEYALHVNAKRREAGSDHPDRSAQFDHIADQRQVFAEAGLPMISVDTKKKELVGNFRNAGQSWSREPEAVNVHDFRSEALGRAVPYGIYDLQHNRGTVVVGTSADTPEFAVEAIARWWDGEGVSTYPGASQLLILADAGGSNGYRPRAWKEQLQEQLCDERGLTVVVCHYPTGCSKWNPIEHRLFSQISINWAGKPLRTWETVLGYLRDTTTTTGLEVKALFQDKAYEAGRSVSNEAMQTLNLEHHAICPQWNYTLRPHQESDGSVAPPIREVVS